MVHTALAKASPVMGSLPRVTPTACVPKPAAIISYMADPMKDNRVHEMGPPKQTSKAIIALSTTREGPSAVMTLLLMASFICSRVRPISRPVELEFFTENERLNQYHSQLRRPHIARRFPNSAFLP